MKIGDFVYVFEKDTQNVAYGKIYKIEQNIDGTIYQIDCINDFYFNISKDSIYTNELAFFNAINLCLIGNKVD